MLEAKFNCAWAAEIEPHVASNAHATVASTDGKRNDLLDAGVIMGGAPRTMTETTRDSRDAALRAWL
jgi:hypothetical protein